MTLLTITAARVLLTLSMVLLLAACGGGVATTTSTEAAATSESPAAAASTNATGCVEQYEEGLDYFPEQVTFEHAEGVTVRYEDTYKVVEVSTLDGEAPLTYVLAQCGTPAPSLDGDLAEAPVIEVPTAKVISLTTTNLPHFDQMDAADHVVGVGTSSYVATESILQRVESGEVEDYAGAEGAPDTEKIIGAQPDLVVMDAFGEAVVEDAQRLTDAGAPTVLNADFNEQTLLGRAEWMKFTSLFLNTEAAANTAFDEIAGKYEAVRTAAADADESPTVFFNTPFEGTWFMPGGQSFHASAIADANGEYVFADDDSTYSLELDIETVLDRARDADVWLQAGSVNGTLKDLRAIDERFKEFKAFREGEVWAYDKSMSPGGGNAVFETAYTRADLFLADLVKILHPDVLPDHELVFFGQVPDKKQ